jgi:predicted RNA-binding Zn-ribbon protein involved in translation (DUF1610 family)
MAKVFDPAKRELSPEMQVLTDAHRKCPTGNIGIALLSSTERRKCPSCGKLVKLKKDGSFHSHKCW